MSAALAAALLSTAARGERLIVDRGTHTLSSGLVIPSHTRLEFAPGAVIDSTAGTSALSISGTTGDQLMLADDTTDGGDTIELAALDAATLVPGDWLLLAADIYWSGVDSEEAGVDQWEGEQVRVLAVEGTTIRLDRPLRGGPYTVAASGWVRKVTHVENVRITGPGRIAGNQTAGSRALLALFTRDAKLQGFEGVDTVSRGFVLQHNIGGEFCNLSARSQPRFGGSYYGFSFAFANQGCLLEDCDSYGWKHGVTFGGGAGTGTAYGINRDVTIRSFRGYRAGLNALDSHAGSENVTFEDCHSIDSGGGLNYRGPSVTVIGGSVKRTVNGTAPDGDEFEGALIPGRGMWLRNQTTRPTSYIVKGMRFEQIAGDQAIRLSVHYPPGTGLQATGLTIDGCHIDQAALYGIEVALTSVTALGPVRGVKLVNNTLTRVESTAIRVADAENIVIANNIGMELDAAGITLDRVTRAKVEGNVLEAADGNVATAIAWRETAAQGVIDGNIASGFTNGITTASNSGSVLIGLNDMSGCTNPFVTAARADQYGFANRRTGGSIASAATLAVEPTRDLYNVTGSTNITSITATFPGHRITLRAGATAAFSVVAGNNIKMAATEALASNEAITLICDGTNWYRADPV